MKLRFIKLLILSLCFNLFACASSEIITGPDGTPHELITCGRIKDCYAKATEVCGGKYKIINTTNAVAGNATYVGSNPEILVKCER